MTVSPTQAYWIYNVSEKDVGPYTCKVWNDFGTSYSTGYVSLAEPALPAVVPVYAAADDKDVTEDDDDQAGVLTAELSLSAQHILLFAAAVTITILGVIAYCIYHQKTKKRQKKHMKAAMKKADDAYLWTRVVVTKLHEVSQTSPLLVAPDVSIEKK